MQEECRRTINEVLYDIPIFLVKYWLNLTKFMENNELCVSFGMVLLSMYASFPFEHF